MNEGRVSARQRHRKKLILKTFLEAGEPVSIAHIAKHISSNYPAVSSVLTRMQEEGLVTHVGPSKSTGGRRPTVYRLNVDKILFAGIEVGHTDSCLLIVNIDGKIKHYSVIENKDIHSSADPLRKLAESTVEYLQNHLRSIDIPMENLKGIGFGFAGDLLKKFSGAKEETYDAIRDMENRLSGYVNLPVLVDNEARLTTSAERLFGKLKNVDNGLNINLQWGIGLGVIMGGKLQKGANGYIEFGHIQVREDGDLCYCGKRGCLESFASGHAITKKAIERVSQGEKSLISEMIEGDLERLDEGIIVKAALAGDIFSIELITEAAKILGLQIANLIKLFDPEKIVINGSLSLAGRLLLNPIRTEVDKYNIYNRWDSLPIEISDFGRTAIALGAVSLHIHDFLKE